MQLLKDKFQPIYYYFHTRPYSLGLFIVILILLLIIYLVATYIKLSRDYKIYNTFSNKIFITIYLSFFIVYLFSLCYFAWGKQIELKIISQKIEIVHAVFLYSLLLFLIMCLTFYLLLLIIIKIRKFFEKEIIKYYLFAIFRYKNNKLLQKSLSYLKLFSYHKLSMLVSFGIQYILDFLFGEFNYNKKSVYKMRYYLYIFFNFLPLFFSVFLVVYDLYYNKKIEMIFYYLPFYFFIGNWKRISEFVSFNEDGFNQIIYDRYYDEENFCYIGTLEEDDNILLEYMERGFFSIRKYYRYTEDYFVKSYEELVWLENFLLKHKYYRDYDKKAMVYYNPNTGERTDDLEQVLKEAKTIS